MHICFIFSKDTVEIDKHNVTNQVFGLADYIAPDSFEETEFDGICGLCTSGYSNIKGRTFLENLKAQEIIDQMLFSFYLVSPTQGVLTIGDYSHEHYQGNLKWIKTEGYLEWELPLTGVQIGNHRIDLENNGVIIDSGTNMIMCPEGQFDTIIQKIDARKMMTHIYEVPCNLRKTLPIIDFNIGDHKFKLDGYGYTFVDEKDRCIVAFAPFNGGVLERTIWILGDVFIRAYFAAFDAEKKRIGLATIAKAKN